MISTLFTYFCLLVHLAFRLLGNNILEKKEYFKVHYFILFFIHLLLLLLFSFYTILQYTEHSKSPEPLKRL